MEYGQYGYQQNGKWKLFFFLFEIEYMNLESGPCIVKTHGPMEEKEQYRIPKY